MTKHNGLITCNMPAFGTQYNTYADGVYTSHSSAGAPLCGRHPIRFRKARWFYQWVQATEQYGN